MCFLHGPNCWFSALKTLIFLMFLCCPLSNGSMGTPQHSTPTKHANDAPQNEKTLVHKSLKKYVGEKFSGGQQLGY